MGFLNYAGYVCLLVFVHEGFCLGETDEEAPDSLLQFLLRRTREQDSKIVALEAKMMKDQTELSDKIAALEAEMMKDRAKLSGKISALEAKVRQSDSKQEELENNIEDLREVIQDLTTKLASQNDETVHLERIQETGEKNKENPVKDQIQDSATVGLRSVKSEQRRILSGGGSLGHVVAFYAYMGQSEPSPGKHHTIIFDTVVTNAGSAYNHHDGVFTAPANGVYVFNWNLYSSYHGDSVSELMVNSDKKGGRRSDSATVNEDHSSSGCVVVALSQGDIVFVRTHPTFSLAGQIISYPDQYESSFSGWLLA